jgi:hypothetical protein
MTEVLKGPKQFTGAIGTAENFTSVFSRAGRFEQISQQYRGSRK